MATKKKTVPLTFDLEKIIFKRHVAIFLDRTNGQLVLDDEPITSKSRTVESKYVTRRKKGKEGPATDCVTCSLSYVIFGIRLRLVGDKEVDNMYKLLEHLPKLVSPYKSIILTLIVGMTDYISFNKSYYIIIRYKPLLPIRFYLNILL